MPLPLMSHVGWEALHMDTQVLPPLLEHNAALDWALGAIPGGTMF
jgi:hypothetical protein